MRIGHGQMRERDLEQLMVDFYHRRFNLLVCTTIIESGIDVPTANTIMINRADHMGLAQLHQLRGRVGRSHHRAYAYLIVPPRKHLPGRCRQAARGHRVDGGARRRLRARHPRSRDPRRRRTPRRAAERPDDRGRPVACTWTCSSTPCGRCAEGREPLLDQPLAAVTEVELRVPALLPEDYVADVHVRLALYKRIAAADASRPR